MNRLGEQLRLNRMVRATEAWHRQRNLSLDIAGAVLDEVQPLVEPRLGSAVKPAAEAVARHLEERGVVVPRKPLFQVEAQGFMVRAFDGSTPGLATIEVTRNGARFKTFLCEAYRVWNIAAHIDDLAAEWLGEVAP